MWTEPFVELTPATSRGFDEIKFAREDLGVRLLPWQEWLLIHMLKLDLSGLLRFCEALVILRWQNAKTAIAAVVDLVAGQSYEVATDRERRRSSTVMGGTSSSSTDGCGPPPFDANEGIPAASLLERVGMARDSDIPRGTPGMPASGRLRVKHASCRMHDRH